MSDPHSQHHAHPEPPKGNPPVAAAMRKSQPHARHEHGALMSDPEMAKAMERDMARRFWIALVLTIPLVIVTGHFPGLPMLAHFPAANWIAFALTTPVVLWSGSVFLTGSVRALRSRRLDMSVLIATGVLAAYLSSIYLTVIGYGTSYFEAAAMLVTFVLFGHWMELKSRRGTSDALRALFDLVPPTARVIRSGTEQVVPTTDVIVGDVLRLLPGEKVPVDGVLTEGVTDVDEALVTGESKPAHKSAGEALVGGSINVSAPVTMTATKVGNDTVLAQIAALVERAQNSKAPGQRIADKAAAILVVVAVSAGLITFLAWTLLADVPFLTALTFAISAVVIACPDALGLATPTAVAVGTGLGARHNILIKDAATLEGVSRIQVILLDKTGTLTVGKPAVTDLVPAEGVSESELLVTAASVSATSTHPLSQAIVRATEERNLAFPAVDSARNVAGKGVVGFISGEPVLVGSAKLLAGESVAMGNLEEAGGGLALDGRSLSYVARGGRVLGVLGSPMRSGRQARRR